MFLLFFFFFFNHINIHQFDSLHTGSFFLSAACSTGFELGFGIWGFVHIWVVLPS